MEQELKTLAEERYDMAMYRLAELERLNRIYFPERFVEEVSGPDHD